MTSLNISARELKANLGTCLKAAAGGETVRVVSRGHVQAMQNARLLAVSELTLVESHSALARLARERKITGQQFKALRRDINADFEEFYFAVQVSVRLIQSACRLLAAHALRAMDALQLASALIVKKTGGSNFYLPALMQGSIWRLKLPDWPFCNQCPDCHEPLCSPD